MKDGQSPNASQWLFSFGDTAYGKKHKWYYKYLIMVGKCYKWYHDYISIDRFSLQITATKKTQLGNHSNGS